MYLYHLFSFLTYKNVTMKKKLRGDKFRVSIQMKNIRLFYEYFFLFTIFFVHSVDVPIASLQRDKTLPTCVLDMTLNNLMTKFQECGVPLHCDCSPINSGLG